MVAAACLRAVEPKAARNSPRFKMLSKSRRLPIQEFFGSLAPKPVRILRNQVFSIKIYASAFSAEGGSSSGGKYSRFGVVVSKKMADKASARVKIKRLVFNFIRTHYKSLPVFDYLILPSPSIMKLSPPDINQSLYDLFF